MQNVMVLDIKKIMDTKMMCGVWDLKISLGNFNPKDLASHKSRTLAPIFTNRTLFYPES